MLLMPLRAGLGPMDVRECYTTMRRLLVSDAERIIHLMLNPPILPMILVPLSHPFHCWSVGRTLFVGAQNCRTWLIYRG